MNLNKAAAAQHELVVELRNTEHFIALISEPYCFRQKLSGIPSTYNVLPCVREGHPRCAIFSSKSIEIHELAQLRTRDVVVGLTCLNRKKVAIISAYMDIKREPVIQELKRAVDYCKLKGYSILLAADSNSHSQIWGNQNNKRGNVWNQCLEEESLLIHNNGKTPTYESKLGKSIIDVTISHKLPVNLENWRVLRSYKGTDHNTLKYNLEKTEISIKKYRQYDKSCLLYTSPSPRDRQKSRMPSSA